MQTTVIGTSNFCAASAMVETCYTALLRAGFIQEANMLHGIEIYSVGAAWTALATLRQIRVEDEAVGGAVRYATATLESLLRQQGSALQLAS